MSNYTSSENIDERNALLYDLELGRIISILYRQRHIFMTHMLSDHDMGSGQHSFLFYLYKHDGATQDEISRALDIDKGTTARALQKLETIGYIRRTPDKDDRRINHVYLTEKGVEIQGSLQMVTRKWVNVLLESFSNDEVKQLSQYLHRLASNSTEYTHKKEGIKHDTTSCKST